MRIICSNCRKSKDRNQFVLGENEKGQRGLMTECYKCRLSLVNEWRWDDISNIDEDSL